MYSKEQVKNAKAVIHHIAFIPGSAKMAVTVVKVRGEFAWVDTGTDLVRLNRVATAKLMRGEYNGH